MQLLYFFYDLRRSAFTLSSSSSFTTNKENKERHSLFFLIQYGVVCLIIKFMITCLRKNYTH